MKSSRASRRTKPTPPVHNLRRNSTSGPKGANSPRWWRKPRQPSAISADRGPHPNPPITACASQLTAPESATKIETAGPRPIFQKNPVVKLERIRKLQGKNTRQALLTMVLSILLKIRTMNAMRRQGTTTSPSTQRR